MNYDFTKFERGQVWMIRFKNTKECAGHEQQKDRPWVILSVGKFNKSSGMVTAAPITTRDNIRTPSQVMFVNDKNVNNVILCEGIRTFDYTSGAYIFDFMGNLSDEVLEKVDVALSIHLGMHYSPITLKSLYDSMEAIIKSVGYMQEKSNTPTFTDQDVRDFAEKLKSLVPVVEPIPDQEEVTLITPFVIDETGTDVKSVDNPEPSLVKPYYVTPPDLPGRTIHTIYADEEPKETKSEKAPRMRWTPAKCREFLADCNNLPMKKVMDKWNISKKTRYYSTKNYVQNLLTKMTQS